MVDLVLCKLTQISISISRTIFLTCFVVAKILLIVILPFSGKNWFLPAKIVAKTIFASKNFLAGNNYFCWSGFSMEKTIQQQKLANPEEVIYELSIGTKIGGLE